MSWMLQDGEVFFVAMRGLELLGRTEKYAES